MSQEQRMVEAEPIFNPDNIGQSIDQISAMIPIRNRWLSGLRAGLAISAHQGSGSEIDGTRDYVPGDDPRHIDWKLSARTPDESYKIREHYNEITPALWVVTDVLGERYNTQAGYFSERNLALSAIAAVIRVAEHQRMPFGLMAANDQEMYAQKRPVSGRRRILPTVNRLQDLYKEDIVPVSLREARKKYGEVSPGPKSVYLSHVLEQAGRLCTRNVVMIVSDFRDVVEPDDPNHGWLPALQNLYRKKQNQILAIETTNPWDTNLPERAGRFTLPNGAIYLDGKKGQAVRRRYSEMADQQQTAINQALSDVNAKHIKLKTEDRKWLTSLEQQLRSAKSKKH